jgi:hypothetical protein
MSEREDTNPRPTDANIRQSQASSSTSQTPTTSENSSLGQVTTARDYLFISDTAPRAASREAVRVHARREAYRSSRGPQNSPGSSRTDLIHQMTFLDANISSSPTNLTAARTQTPVSVQDTTTGNDSRGSGDFRVGDSAHVNWQLLADNCKPLFLQRLVSEMHGKATDSRLETPVAYHISAQMLSFCVTTMRRQSMRI